MNYTLGYGLMTLLVGIYLLADRDSWARSLASSATWWKRLLWVAHVPGEREEEQKTFVVMTGIILVILGMVMVAVGGYWWMTS